MRLWPTAWHTASCWLGHVGGAMRAEHVSSAPPYPTLGQVVGATAMLGGVTRMTISITVLAMEGTGALQLIVPLMLAALLAKVRQPPVLYPTLP